MPDGQMMAAMAYEIVHDELMLDGNPSPKLATFVTTHMESLARLPRQRRSLLDRNESTRRIYLVSR
jgi:glutamate decarboxylase